MYPAPLGVQVICGYRGRMREALVKVKQPTPMQTKQERSCLRGIMWRVHPCVNWWDRDCGLDCIWLPLLTWPPPFPPIVAYKYHTFLVLYKWWRSSDWNILEKYDLLWSAPISACSCQMHTLLIPSAYMYSASVRTLETPWRVSSAISSPTPSWTWNMLMLLIYPLALLGSRCWLHPYMTVIRWDLLLRYA